MYNTQSNLSTTIDVSCSKEAHGHAYTHQAALPILSALSWHLSFPLAVCWHIFDVCCCRNLIRALIVRPGRRNCFSATSVRSEVIDRFEDGARRLQSNRSRLLIPKVSKASSKLPGGGTDANQSWRGFLSSNHSTVEVTNNFWILSLKVSSG